MFQNKHILLIVSGSVAAYKSAYFLRLLIKQGAQVHVSMTAAAEKFVSPLTFATLSRFPVLTDIFQAEDGSVPHIEWAQWADYIFVLPASADIIAKIANGIADDTASTIILASQAKKIVAPAMNDQMWDNPATVRNIQQLKRDGILIIDPADGFLAEGYEAKGRLPEPEDILEQAQMRLLAEHGSLHGKNILITAGGTREAIDPVRYISNRSSGKMGYALAQAAAEAGAKVTLIATQIRHLPYSVSLIKVESAQEMLQAVQDQFPQQDIFISAAAVSDYRIVHPAKEKIKKTGKNDLTLVLQQNPDILADAGSHKTGHQFVVGFAAETQNLAVYAQEKLVKKHADMIIANDVSSTASGFNSDQNQVTIFQNKKTAITLPLQDKQKLARGIMTEISNSIQ
ncbi:bifunctional phosphopantothenoylcysteine decarboxylase/phosphopantothenate--cysteine ligase CoaBC [Oenococcus kitaharae]|uniref:Coenzyme A biosynthesis bifunctional protein CoaBC n=1 Tax=Oenococcus kitaharae DSM 17330 TaxID=1045004 RepID=G9WG65_9LACO|nr:bifunctional phosphopantothenoylcysteine decarboxylase/phosphopantothenate--cysteine ligase CoaBC [Oenococcus kitaharae]EHN59673.1 Phosphopantothenoylcysteine decarboxylase [Oenococcus kitaharae DSM 17330]OEY83510.1 phosphopantothenoylcysteine decarboxylase [Oenococcus kitaharae]OEY85309.1 phosphopantothenoylcysteine decarboxylase [Oenococcus kitaharae]OEY86163.1 phosphopantothenoylcysteine decarboxylase [Oenococcus kitaharae]